MSYFSLEQQEQLSTLMLPILGLIGLFFALGIDSYIQKPLKRVLLVINVIVLTVILDNFMGSALNAAWKPQYRLPQAWMMRPMC